MTLIQEKLFEIKDAGLSYYFNGLDDRWGAWLHYVDRYDNWFECFVKNTRPEDTRKLLLHLGIHPLKENNGVKEPRHAYNLCFNEEYDVWILNDIPKEDWYKMIIMDYSEEVSSLSEIGINLFSFIINS
jgi:hypothetical protein